MEWATMRTRSRIWSDCLERVHVHGVFVKNRITTTPKKEKEKEKKRAKRLKELLVYLFRDFDVL
tara:strand:+ start:297 stop:488 length:192 start_codon:yes stop_codon:yes gene_type:complete